MGRKSGGRKRSRERDSRRYDSLLAFIHIPRSGGGTLSTAIAGSYARPKGAGNFQKSPDEARRKVRVVAANPGRWGAVADHVPYGLCRRHLPPDTLYLTILREPVDRVLSHYQFHLRKGTRKLSTVWDQLASLDAAERALDPRARPASATEIADTSLQAGLVNRITIYDNLATRFLWGGESIFGELPTDALERAKENISRFTLVGITERFDESVVLLGRELGAGLMPYRFRHVNPARRTEQVPDELRESIRERNALDLELYRFATELFEAKAASAQGLAEDAEKLRRLSEAAAEEAAAAAEEGTAAAEEAPVAVAREPQPPSPRAAKSARRATRALEGIAKARESPPS